jgi:hypothetical protein
MSVVRREGYLATLKRNLFPASSKKQRGVLISQNPSGCPEPRPSTGRGLGTRGRVPRQDPGQKPADRPSLPEKDESRPDVSRDGGFRA